MVIGLSCVLFSSNRIIDSIHIYSKRKVEVQVKAQNLKNTKSTRNKKLKRRKVKAILSQTFTQSQCRCRL